MSSEDRWLAVGAYLFFGWLTMATAIGVEDVPLGEGDKLSTDSLGPALAVILLWPLFAVKYIAMFVWFILSSGYTALV